MTMRREPVGIYPPSGTTAPLALQSSAVRDGGLIMSTDSTTGSISLSTPTTLTVASVPSSFQVGQGVAIAGAGSAAALLQTHITVISGTTLTIADAASTAVTDADVYYDGTYKLQAWLNGLSAQSAGVIPVGAVYCAGLSMPSKDLHLCGAGVLFGTVLRLIPGANTYLLEATGANRYVFKDLLFDGNAGNGGPGNESGGTYLVDLQQPYLTSLQSVWIYQGYAAGLHLGSAGSAISLYDCLITHNGTWGLVNDADDVHVVGGKTFEYNGTGGIVSGLNASVLTLKVRDVRFEEDSIALAAYQTEGITIEDCYLLDSRVYLDPYCTNCRIADNDIAKVAVDEIIRNAGLGCIVENNWGETKYVNKGDARTLYPSSLAADPYMASSGTGSWTATNATLVKDVVKSSVYSPSPLSVTPSSAGGGASQEIAVSASTGYLIEVMFSTVESGQSVQIAVTDVTNSTTLVTSADLATPTFSSSSQYNSQLREGVWQTAIETASTTATIKVAINSVNNTTPFWITGLNVVSIPVANGGFEGTYSSGVAPSWSSTGTGATFTEDTAHFHTGSSAQRIETDATHSAWVSQSVTLTDGHVYLVSGWVYLNTSASNAVLALGNISGNGPGQPPVAQCGTTPFIVNGWQYLSLIVKADSAVTNAIYCYVYPKNSTACDVTFDDVAIIDLGAAS